VLSFQKREVKEGGKKKLRPSGLRLSATEEVSGEFLKKREHRALGGENSERGRRWCRQPQGDLIAPDAAGEEEEEGLCRFGRLFVHKRGEMSRKGRGGKD